MENCDIFLQYRAQTIRDNTRRILFHTTVIVLSGDHFTVHCRYQHYVASYYYHIIDNNVTPTRIILYNDIFFQSVLSKNIN